MRVLITGATGFVGSHVAAELVRAGHEVVALARTPARVAEVMAPRDVELHGVVQGDMTDPVAVAGALDGCEAVVHAAAQIGVSGGTESALAANVEGVRQVVGQAVDRGCDPVIYTSTFSVHLPATDEVVGPATPLSAPLSAYGQSKVECEQMVTSWQAEGAPVTTLVLGGVYGPDSPHADGSAGALLSMLAAGAVETDGGLAIIDVRDVAALVAAALVPGRGPHRLMAGGTFVTWPEYGDLLAEVAGRDVPRFVMTADQMIATGRQLDQRRAVGESVAMPLTEDAAVIMTAGRPTDDRATWSLLGGAPRPLRQTLRDAVASLVDQGRLDAADVPGIDC